MDAYLEEELYDLLTFCMQNERASPDYDSKKERIHEIGKRFTVTGEQMQWRTCTLPSKTG
ncbi:hypothetical protein DYY67_2227 [Candidatus Nitrosotalea sp. TS]|uniref:hypothetical protein n=1 Tax=Candidatus Nitrosotalea sp. TS TaxID=2341020 RepID=UPI001EB941C1|nr:hypothetical protein [Candidatus Nitrosotalea sp. TS]NHI04559.1 hypothetical protein [Candidatus Nitrosotalea sp. TS]